MIDFIVLHSPCPKAPVAMLIMMMAVNVSVARPVGPPPDEALRPPGFQPVEVASALPERDTDKEDEIEELYFVDESVYQVLDILARLKDRKLLTTESLPNPRLSFDSRGSISIGEAIIAIESLLSMNGIAVSEMGDSFIRVFPANAIRKKSPEILQSSTLELPTSEKVYSKVFELRYLLPEKLEGILKNSITDGTGYLEFVPGERSFLATDSLSNLKRIELLVSKLDKPTDQDLIVYQLRYVDAKKVSENLKTAIDSTLGGFIEGKVAISADEYSNQLIVVSEAGNGKLIREMIEMMDVDTYPLTRSEVFRLKHANAAEVVEIINDLISSQKKDGDSPDVNLDILETSPQRKQQFSRYVKLVADERSNSIVVKGTDADIESTSRLISEIDVHLAQVKIDVIITEVTLSKEHSRGIEKFGVSYDENDEISFSLNEGSDLGLSMDGYLTDLIFQGLTLREFTLATVFDTAKKDSDVNVVSSPTLVTMHNKEAIINAGESRPVITSTNTDSTGLNTRSQVQFKDIGIQLKVKPLIGSDGAVQLEIEQTVESVVDEVLIDGNSQPVIGKREATSFVSVEDGQLIVLGGLQEKSIRKVGGRLSLLGNIPLIGKMLFSSERKNELNRELIIFLRPTVFYGLKDSAQYSSDLKQAGVESGLLDESYFSSGEVNRTETVDMEESKN